MNSNQLNSDNIMFQIEQSTNIGAIQQPPTIDLEKRRSKNCITITTTLFTKLMAQTRQIKNPKNSCISS